MASSKINKPFEITYNNKVDHIRVFYDDDNKSVGIMFQLTRENNLNNVAAIEFRGDTNKVMYRIFKEGTKIYDKSATLS